MEGQFKIGEVLVGQNFVICPEFNGCECVVVGALKMREGINVATGLLATDLQYAVQWSTGKITNARPYLLRRKQPPAGEQSILAMFKVSRPKRIGEPA